MSPNSVAGGVGVGVASGVDGVGVTGRLANDVGSPITVTPISNLLGAAVLSDWPEVVMVESEVTVVVGVGVDVVVDTGVGVRVGVAVAGGTG